MNRIASLLVALLLASIPASAQIVAAPWLGWNPPPATGTVFADVPADSFAADWIESMYADGITSGCGTDPLVFCPSAPTTRAQMSVFIGRVYHAILPGGGSVLYGVGSCGDQAPDAFTTGHRCTGTVADPRIIPGMAIVATYTSHGNGELNFPIEVSGVVAGSFDFSIQEPSAFSWIATGGTP